MHYNCYLDDKGMQSTLSHTHTKLTWINNGDSVRIYKKIKSILKCEFNREGFIQFLISINQNLNIDTANLIGLREGDFMGDAKKVNATCKFPINKQYLAQRAWSSSIFESKLHALK